MNKITKVFNNIGSYCSLQDNSFILNKNIPGYQNLDNTSIGYFIPYLVRNIKDTYKWEVGVGEVVSINNNIIVKRYEISNSSNHNSSVNFTGTDNEFYLFVNNINFNSAFNNVILKNNHFTIDNISCIYLVDTSSANIDCVLTEPKTSRNITIDLKALNNYHNIIVRDHNGSIFTSTNSCIRLVCDGQTWYILNETDSAMDVQTLSSPESSYSIQSNPGGEPYSFQVNDGSNGLIGTNVYWSSGNSNTILLGSDSESSAHTVIPTSGSDNVVFNKDYQASDFIIYGSGQPHRNLFFSYDGRVGVNIPSGSRPQTIFHVVNYSCSEILRLENRTACQPAKLTLYHKPSGLSNGGICSVLNLAGRDINNNQKDYANIYSIADDTANGYGGIVLSVSSGNNQQSIVSGNLNSIRLGYDNTKQITLNNNGDVAVSGSNINIRSSSSLSVGTTRTSATFNNSANNISLNYATLSLGSGTITSNGTLSVNNINANNITLPNIAPSSLLTVSNTNTLIPISGIAINPTNNGLLLNNISGNRFLTTDSGNNIVGIYSIDDYFLTEKDIVWNKYPKRPASICLRQIALDAPVPMEEFSVGDELAIVSASQIYYRNITSLDIENNNIVGMLIDQVISPTENTSNIDIYSITKGGYLSIKMHTEPGSLSDPTANILSIRPLTDTVFNTSHKDINFSVYGIDPIPALTIKSNSGRGVQNSGVYYQYSTQDNREPFAIQISASGNGINNLNNTANFQYTASGRFSGMVTDVGSNGQSSFYGTYDQNGNVAEWIEDSNHNSVSLYQYVAGGAWTSMSGESLQSIALTNYSGSYPDIGFRVCSLDGLVDNTNLEFVTINQPYNTSNNSNIYVLSNNNLVPSGISNLGSVNHIYRIGKYEVTNQQYASFLNAVATVSDLYGLYSTDMTSSPYGGIARSGTAGSYSYHTKDNMENKPVNFVSYLSAIRFSNWLHNSAPTGTEALNNSVIENGAYEILSLGNNSYQINKNSYQNYWIPTIHEWHKAAYFMPEAGVSSSGTSSVMIKRKDPFVISTGLSNIEYANLSVSGWLYADKLCIGDGSFISEGGPQSTGIKYIKTSGNTISFLNDTIVFESGSYRVKLGNQNNISLTTGKTLWDKTYGNYLSSNSGIELSTTSDISLISSTGNIKIYSTGYVNFSGIQADTILAKNFKKVGDTGVEEPIYLGASGSLVYKKDNFTPGTSDQFIFDSANKLNFPGGERNSPIYVANTGSGMVATYTGVHYLPDSIEMYNPVIMPQIQIGDDKPFFKGSILTHAGTGYATWEPAEYLKADGMLWNRYIKRPVLIYENRFVFDTALNDGNIDASQAILEFGYSDTIALINEDTREKTFVKAADDALHVIDNNGELISLNEDVITTDVKGLGMSFCPASPWPLVSGCLPISGYAYAVNKGGYLTMQLDPVATSGFSCEAGIIPNDGSGYSFKPSTLNTISIRPFTSTAFNLLAEDIDFAIYGAHTTKYHRYDASVFGLDNNGLPSGLTPAFKVDAINYNAVSGNPQSGVYFSGYLDQNGTQPTGYKLDETGKVCINTKSPYVISSIPSGTGTLDVLTDLTIKGYTYTSGLITTELFVRPIPDLNGTGKFVVNAPLTVNSQGQIISQIPATAPTVPGSPTEVFGESGNGCVTLNWVPPTNNGGRNILNYLIEYSLNDGNSWTTYNRPASIELTSLITGLTNGASYIFRVSAVNAIGAGAPSASTNNIMPLATKPSEPRNLTTTKNNLSRTLSWSAPSLTGSSAIVTYTVEYSNDYGLTWIVANNNINAALRSYTITGLDNDPTYYIRIKATNSTGSGAYAQTISIGDDPYVPPVVGDDDSSNIWDFGKILFTGVCV